MATELPVIFQFPGNSILNQILINQNTAFTINKNNFNGLTKDDINKMVTELPKGFWDDKFYTKNIVRGNNTFTVVLPVPFSKISGLSLIEIGGRTYFLVSVDWRDRDNSDKMNAEPERITRALEAQHGIDPDFDFVTPEQQARNDQILRDTGLLGGKSKKSKKFRKNNKKNRKTKTLKGGLSFSFRRAPKSTTEILTDFHKKIGNIRLKDIEPKFVSNIDKLRKRRDECIPKCLAAGEDEVTRKQMQSMMDTKSFYEWGTTCSNGFNIKKCKEFLHTYKKLDTYSKYIQGLNNNIQEHFNNITQELLNVNKNENKNKELEKDTSAQLRAALVKSRSSSQSQKSRKSKSSSNSMFSPLSSLGSSDYSFKSTNSRLSAF